MELKINLLIGEKLGKSVIYNNSIEGSESYNLLSIVFLILSLPE